MAESNGKPEGAKGRLRTLLGRLPVFGASSPQGSAVTVLDASQELRERIEIMLTQPGLPGVKSERCGPEDGAWYAEDFKLTLLPGEGEERHPQHGVWVLLSHTTVMARSERAPRLVVRVITITHDGRLHFKLSGRRHDDQDFGNVTLQHTIFDVEDHEPGLVTYVWAGDGMTALVNDAATAELERRAQEESRELPAGSDRDHMLATGTLEQFRLIPGVV